MSDVIEIPGEPLTLAEYFADFEREFWRSDNRPCWKLERRQSFVEQGSDSYDAFARGEWRRSLELLRFRRPSIGEYYAKAAQRGIRVLRARVVEKPISSYLMWQLHSLQQRSELGERPRIVKPQQVVEFERDAPLPELVGLGHEILYQVVFGPDGTAERAIRSTDRPTIDHWHGVFRKLYDGGEDMSSFFEHSVAGRRPSNAQESSAC